MYSHEPSSLMVEEEKLFYVQHVTLKTMLDGWTVSNNPDYLTAVASLIAMYWVFNVALARERTLPIRYIFLVCHVLELSSGQSVSQVKTCC